MKNEETKAIGVMSETVQAGEEHHVRSLTISQNAVLTAKVLGTIGLIGAALWGADMLTSVR